jgi:hypothetical protein
VAVDQSTVRLSQHRDPVAAKDTVMRSMSSERGAALMNVILGIVLLIGINTFVVDYGVMWVGRGAAQNAADAGALAGAVAMGFDDYDDRSDTGLAKTSAWKTSQENYIWGSAPKVDITTDVTFPKVPANPCADDSCIRVDVYRNVAGGNPLPVLFGTAIGLSGQGVRAMAIARAGAANASDCLKPFAIPDKWLDKYDDSGVKDVDTWTTDDTFDVDYPKGSKNAGDPIIAPDAPDVYVKPTKTDPGTGFKAKGTPNDLGVQLTLKEATASEAVAPGNYYAVDLPLASGAPESGGKNFRQNIAECNGVPIGIDTELVVEPGGMAGPAAQGVEALIAKDPYATWNPTTKSVDGGCLGAGTCSRSPRVVAIPLYDTGLFETSRKQTGRGTVKIVNILGFFIADVAKGKNDISGYLTTVPGLMVNGPAVGKESAFASVIQLVR